MSHSDHSSNLSGPQQSKSRWRGRRLNKHHPSEGQQYAPAQRHPSPRRGRSADSSGSTTRSAVNRSRSRGVGNSRDGTRNGSSAGVGPHDQGQLIRANSRQSYHRRHRPGGYPRSSAAGSTKYDDDDEEEEVYVKDKRGNWHRAKSTNKRGRNRGSGDDGEERWDSEDEEEWRRRRLRHRRKKKDGGFILATVIFVASLVFCWSELAD